MFTKRSCDLLHGLDAAAHGQGAPVVQKGPRPNEGFVVPEVAKKDSLRFQARAVASLLSSSALSLRRAIPRTRLPRRSSFQRMLLSFSAMVGRVGGPSQRDGLGPVPGSNAW